MRLLLVGPEREENLSLRYLAAALHAAGHVADLARFDGLDDLTSVLQRATRYDGVGLSMCFQARAREFLTLATALKLHHSERPVIAGGHYATCAARELLTHHPDLDLIVLHEGERTLVELADAGLDSGAYEGIAGIAFRDAGEVRTTQPRPMVTDLDTLPFPDRRGRVRMLAGVPTAYLFGSRGCFSSCDYCCIVALHRTAPGPRFRQRSVANIADEMAELYHERGIRQFVFHDDNFLVPSPRRNHERLDALDAAWAERGIHDIGLVLKCRPGDLEPSVLVRLREMGLLRLFLGVESGSDAGLCSIGRRQRVAEAEAALALCRRHGVSAQYTLMCFHPDATVETLRADLDFMRRHGRHPFNFCRVETYAGTAIEARLRAQGRGRGDYLARTYAIADPVVDDTCRLALRMFYDRCWATDSLMETAIGLNHVAAVGRHFHASPGVHRIAAAIDDWQYEVNRELISLLDELLAIRLETRGLDDPELQRRAGELVRRERASRPRYQARARELRRALEAAARRPGRFRDEGGPRPAPPKTLMKTAAATALAVSLVSCGNVDNGVSEYAAPPLVPPPPLVDSDGDGLPDYCETTIFGTDPHSADTDGDGTPDGDEMHDDGYMTNAEEQAVFGDRTCGDATDTPVSEYAPEPLVDSDGDGLPDECETSVFGTDPNQVDSDGDGVVDGAENHDGGTMRNGSEQAMIGLYDCGDWDDGAVAEMAPSPLVDTDGDGLPDECETSVFGTDPERIDSDGDGLPDGAENHDGGTMNNAEEQSHYWGTCGDVDDGVEEGAAQPLPDPDDPTSLRWARAIFGEPDDEGSA